MSSSTKVWPRSKPSDLVLDFASIGRAPEAPQPLPAISTAPRCGAKTRRGNINGSGKKCRCSRDAKPQDGPLPCRAFIIFATLVGIAWVLWFWRKPVRINAIGINPRPSVQNGGDAGSATMRGMRGQDPEGKYKW